MRTVLFFCSYWPRIKCSRILAIDILCLRVNPPLVMINFVTALTSNNELYVLRQLCTSSENCREVSGLYLHANFTALTLILGI